MDISNITDIKELKAAVYDASVLIQNTNNHIDLMNRRIEELSKLSSIEDVKKEEAQATQEPLQQSDTDNATVGV